MAKNINTEGNDFKLERYKYILQQLNALNEQTHKYLTLFQALITALVGGGVLIFITWKELKIEAVLARVGLRAVVLLLIISGLFVIISIVSSMLSWMDYRREEVRLLSTIVGPEFRALPKWRNIWRWHEFYVLLFLMLVTLSLVLFFECWILPLTY